MSFLFLLFNFMKHWKNDTKEKDGLRSFKIVDTFIARNNWTTDLWVPLVFYILIRGRAWNGKADDKDICLWVGERPQSVVLLLTCRVP